ncbi:hypothetical protein [Mycoplasmoides gallisepticum]|uniref:hypothetical protein n=1 Tax=Mycoplasmoides gallisepticum TaxID=2096 RepID=UPI0037045B99
MNKQFGSNNEQEDKFDLKTDQSNQINEQKENDHQADDYTFDYIQTNKSSSQSDLVNQQEEKNELLNKSAPIQKVETNIEDLKVETNLQELKAETPKVEDQKTSAPVEKNEIKPQEQKFDSKLEAEPGATNLEDQKAESKAEEQIEETQETKAVKEIPALDEKTLLSIKKLLDQSNVALVPVPSAFNNYTNNTQQAADDKYHLNYANVTVDPINNFYQKIVDSVNPLVDDYIKSLVNENHEPLKQQQVLITESKNIEKNMKNLYKTQKILGRKVANVFIIISFFLIFGLGLIPIFLKNKKIIKEFDSYRTIRQNELDQLWWASYSLSLQFASRLNFNEMLKFITNKLNLGFSNYCSQDTYQFISHCMDNFLNLHSAFNFKYKNTEITDCVATYKEWRMVTTSNAIQVPYIDFETYTTSNGQLATRRVTRYETLVGYHNEKTPFFDDKHFQILKTNFKPEFNFTTNLKTKSDKTKIKNFIMFENKEFSKKMRITNDKNEISAELLEFFTIKSQEDYLNWAKELNHEFNITKNGRYLINDYIDSASELDSLTQPPKKASKKDLENPLYDYSSLDLNVAYHINKFSLKHLVSNKKQTVSELIEIFKQTTKYYLSDWAEQVTPFLLSPVINREWYSSDHNYKIANSGTFDDHESTKVQPSYSYLLSKVYQNDLVYFNQNKASTKSWFEINQLDLENHFLKYEIAHKSYRAVKEIDYVVVVGVHVGAQTIPVPYTRYYPISEPKTVYFLAKNRAKNNNFIISNKKWDGFFDLAQKANIPIINLDKIKLNPHTSIELQNPYQFLSDPKNQAYLDLLEQIQNNCSNQIHVQANDDGYFIFVNSAKQEELEQENFVKSLAKLKNNLLELRELEN